MTSRHREIARMMNSIRMMSFDDDDDEEKKEDEENREPGVIREPDKDG